MIQALDPPVGLPAGRPHVWTFRVTGPAHARLAARWITHDGRPFGPPVEFSPPGPLPPGRPHDLAVTLPTPDPPGDFVLEAVLAPSAGGRPVGCRTPVAVYPDPSSDIDYRAVFRAVDLTRNHWVVAGGYQSEEEFRRSSRERLGMLQSVGLTPDGRVLDIGCGTGQLALALDGYLSDRGAYYATDIAPEAVAFCRARYRRPNFVFEPGEMTRVPFDAAAGPFDLAVFFSVFTHVFPDEAVLLAAEAKRLLGPAGAVVADVIVTPLAGRAVGNRGEVRVNRDHFLRLMAAVGFAGEVLGTFPWGPHAERLMFRFGLARSS